MSHIDEAFIIANIWMAAYLTRGWRCLMAFLWMTGWLLERFT